MRRREFIKNVGMGTSAAFIAGRNQAFAQKQVTSTENRKPNLVFIFSDQQSFDMVGCNGNKQISTPHTDRLASEGVNLTSCFASAPLCTPFRGMLLSGQHPLYNGAVDNNWQMRAGNGQHFGEVLRDNGYRTGYVGKWHLYGGYWYKPIPEGPHRHGFDHTFLSNNCDLNYTPENAFYWSDSGSRIQFQEWEQVGQTRQALDFIDQADKDDDPFALFVSWHPPHDHRTLEHYGSYQAPPEALARHDKKKIKLRPGVEDNELHRTMMHGYMGLCSSVDDCLGMITKKLKERGLEEDTIVIYTSDHGDMLRYIGKERLAKLRPDPHSSQVPFIAKWPKKLKANTKNGTVFGTLDIMPTVLGLMGIQPPESCHGIDLSKALINQEEDSVDSAPFMLFSVFNWRGVYTRDYIYGWSPEGIAARDYPLGCNVLFDRKSDPQGQHNLLGQRQYKAIQKELHEKTLQWLDRFEDPFVPYRTQLEACIKPTEIAGQPWIPFNTPGIDGIPMDRPIDIIKRNNIKGHYS